MSGRRVAWPRGKVIGGSGSINGPVFRRGAARDFDEWERPAGGLRPYLRPSLRRPKLHVRQRSCVRLILFDGNRAVGVELGRGALPMRSMIRSRISPVDRCLTSADMVEHIRREGSTGSHRGAGWVSTAIDGGFRN